MSQVFSPFRVLGLCCSDVPFVIKYSGHNNTYNLVVPIGERFNIYKHNHSAGDAIPNPIRAFAALENFIYAAAENKIYVFRNSRYLAHEFPAHDCQIIDLITFSGNLASLDEEYNLKVWSLQSYAKAFKITAICHPLGFKNKLLFGSEQGPLQLWNVVSQKQLYWFKGFGSSVTCITQAPALDVCAIGLSDGRIILHNLKYDTTLLQFAQDGGPVSSIDFRCGSRGIQNPSNLPEENGFVLLPSEDQDIYMMTGCATGLLSCWQLQENGKSRPVGQTKQMHWGRIVGIYCIPGGEHSGAMVTVGADNCIKVSYFDRPDGGPRTQYRRAGHFEPPNRILFWPGSSAGGSLLISAGQDSVLRIFSTFNEHFDKSMGRAYAPGVPDRRKLNSDQRSQWILPGITQLGACATRAEAWDSVVALHQGRRQVTTWNFVNATRGRHWLDPMKFRTQMGEAVRLYKHTEATSIFITNCGNYVLVGYSSGDVFKFNIQSGLERGSFGNPTAHSCPVSGLCVNHVNRLVCTVGGSKIRFWSFYEHQLLDELDIETTVLFTRFHGDNDILALALANSHLVLVDIVHKCVMRRFPNPDQHPCVDMTFSSDGRWLVSAHRGDSLVKTWDIIDGKLLDCFRVNLPITSLALSPANEFLATTHANSLGVYLWDNRATYRQLHLKPLAFDYVPPADSIPVNLPNRSMIACVKTDSVEISMRDSNTDNDLDEDMGTPTDLDCKQVGADESKSSCYTSPDQLPGNLATLSGLPSNYFNSLVHLDLIRERNRQATQLPSAQTQSKLPFFLPVKETTQGIVWQDDQDDQTQQNPGHRRRKRKPQGMLDTSTLDGLEPVPGLSNRLTQFKSDEEYDRLASLLKSLSPSALDLEIRLLGPTDNYQKITASSDQVDQPHQLVLVSRERLHGFLRFLINRFERNLDVDFASACLEIVLQRHGDLILAQGDQANQFESEIRQILQESTSDQSETLNLIQAACQAKSKAQHILTNHLTRSICLVDFIRNPTTTLQFG